MLLVVLLLSLEVAAVGSVRIQASLFKLELVLILILRLQRLLILRQVQVIHERVIFLHLLLLLMHLMHSGRRLSRMLQVIRLLLDLIIRVMRRLKLRICIASWGRLMQLHDIDLLQTTALLGQIVSMVVILLFLL